MLLSWSAATWRWNCAETFAKIRQTLIIIIFSFLAWINRLYKVTFCGYLSFALEFARLKDADKREQLILRASENAKMLFLCLPRSVSHPLPFSSHTYNSSLFLTRVISTPFSQSAFSLSLSPIDYISPVKHEIDFRGCFDDSKFPQK